MLFYTWCLRSLPLVSWDGCGMRLYRGQIPIYTKLEQGMVNRGLLNPWLEQTSIGRDESVKCRPPGISGIGL